MRSPKMFPSSESLVNTEKKALGVSVLLHPAGAVFPLQLAEEQVRPLEGTWFPKARGQGALSIPRAPSLPSLPARQLQRKVPWTVLWGELYLLPKIHMLKS